MTLEAKPITKLVLRNERKKEKRLQLLLKKEKNIEATTAKDSREQEMVSVNNLGRTSEFVKSLTSQMNELAVSGNSSFVALSSEFVEGSDAAGQGQDTDK